jgi:hypothetical protein
MIGHRQVELHLFYKLLQVWLLKDANNAIPLRLNTVSSILYFLCKSNGLCQRW